MSKKKAAPPPFSVEEFVLTPPEPIAKKVKRQPPAVATGRNPYKIETPAVISFSGGRTSGYMLRKILDAFGGSLPEDVVVTFANTGKEREETLEFVEACSRHWGVEIIWLEYDGQAENKLRRVNFATASRKGEPYLELVRERGYLPNVVTRFCTADLKIKVMGRYMRTVMASLGMPDEPWTVAVGLRYDEPSRVAKIYGPQKDRWENDAPLYHARVTKNDVMAFWAEQPFDLQLQSYEGNCDLCFLKGVHRRARIMYENPEAAQWWIDLERETGNLFIKPDREPGGYASLARKVRLLPMIPELIEAEDDSIDCNCTD